MLNEKIAQRLSRVVDEKSLQEFKNYIYKTEIANNINLMSAIFNTAQKRLEQVKDKESKEDKNNINNDIVKTVEHIASKQMQDNNKEYFRAEAEKNKSFEELNIIEKHVLIDKLLDQENKSIHNFTNAIFIARKDGQTLVQESSSIWDFKVLFYLYKFHKQGIVKDITMKDIAEYYGQENIRHIIKAINNLESLEIITVDRNIKPYQYVILNYSQNKKKDGLFAVPEEFMKENRVTKLKYFRASWYYMAHNHHDPYNKNSLDLSLNKLKEIINAQSYEEVKRVLKELLGDFFEDISFEDERAAEKKRDKKGLNLVSVIFNTAKLGIIKGMNLTDSLANHQLFEKIGTAMVKMDIKFTVPNLLKAMTAINKGFSEFILDKLIIKIDKEKLKSEYKTVNYLLKMLEVVDQELSQPKYST